MGLGNYLSKWIGKIKISSEQTVVIDIPATIYYEELAIYTAQSYLANAISMCEMRVFSKGKPVKNEDYYLLNVSPNKNENSNYFWHKVIRKMIREEKGALVVEINGELHCAEDFSILEERPILGNIYGGVVLAGGLQLNKIFTAQEGMEEKVLQAMKKVGFDKSNTETIYDYVEKSGETMVEIATMEFSKVEKRCRV